MTDAIADKLAVERGGNAFTGVQLNWPNPTFAELAGAGTHEQLVEAILALDYFNTVYRDDGSVAPVEDYQFPKEYLATIIHPVPGGLIKNGWYDPRSRRTRLHMGTDIQAPFENADSLRDGWRCQICRLSSDSRLLCDGSKTRMDMCIITITCSN